MRDLKAEREALRKQRTRECFPIVNRGKLWYNCLTNEELAQLDNWYWAWLDVTDTLVIPTKPQFLKEKLNKEETII